MPITTPSHPRDHTYSTICTTPDDLTDVLIGEKGRERERGSKAPLALSNLGYPGYITCIHTIHTAPPYNRLIISQPEHLH